MTVRLPSPLAAARERAGHTQESLAELLAVERTTIGRWERGRQLPQPLQRRRLAAALRLSLTELDEILNSVSRRAVDRSSGPAVKESSSGAADVVRAALPALRRALDRIDLPDDGPTRHPIDLFGEVGRVSDDRLQARYGSLARRLPDLVAELARSTQLGDIGARRQAAALLTLALRAADGVAFNSATSTCPRG